MANFSTSNKRKRGRAADKLSVRLFLLDPEKETTKVTKEIGSEKGINELKQKGCGPPRPGMRKFIRSFLDSEINHIVCNPYWTVYT